MIPAINQAVPRANIQQQHSVMNNTDMFNFLMLTALTIMLLQPVSGAANAPATAPQRIVAVGGAITEIVYALHREQTLVGVDTSSQWPKTASALPQVGYMRNLSAEGLLSLSPSLLLMSHEAGPPAVLEQIKTAGISVTELTDDKTPEGAIHKIRTVAKTLDAVAEGEKLVTQLQADLKQLTQFKLQHPSHPKVLFLFSVKQGSIMASGRNTAADAMIELAGAQNVFSDYDNFKPVNSEALITAAPEVLLVTDLTVSSVGGVDKILELPGIALTPAGKNRRVIVMDTLYLLGFGPRLGQAAVDLAQQLQP